MNRITVVVFGAILFLSLFTQLLPDKQFSEQENRYLQSMPKLSWDSLMSGRFTSNFEMYIQDHFFLRDEWIKEKVRLEQLIGKVESKDVYLGPDGWYFEVDQNRNEEQLKSNINYLLSFQNWLADNEINTAFIPIYSSYTFYDELLPKDHLNIDQKEIVKQIPSEMIVFDNYDSLWRQKENDIYFKTDHHWTQQGAYYAYETIALQMGWDVTSLSSYRQMTADQVFYGTLYSKAPRRKQIGDEFTYYIDNKYTYSLSIPEANLVSNSLYDEDALTKKDMYTAFLGGNYGVTIIERHDKLQDQMKSVENEELTKDSTLVLFKDSYSHALAPFLAQHYDKVVLIDMRYFNGSIREYIEELQPTDVMFAYNVSWFAKDVTLKKWNK